MVPINVDQMVGEPAMSFVSHPNQILICQMHPEDLNTLFSKHIRTHLNSALVPGNSPEWLWIRCTEWGGVSLWEHAGVVQHIRSTGSLLGGSEVNSKGNSFRGFQIGFSSQEKVNSQGHINTVQNSKIWQHTSNKRLSKWWYNSITGGSVQPSRVTDTKGCL